MDTIAGGQEGRMRASLSINFPEWKEVQNSLQYLTSYQFYQIIQQALRKNFSPTLKLAKNIVKAEDKDTAPSVRMSKDGFAFSRKSLLDSLKIIEGAKRLKHLSVRIVPMRKAPFYAFHAPLFHYPSKQNRQTKEGENRGRMKGTYFLTKALDQTKENAQNNLMQDITRVLDKFWSKHKVI